MGVDSWNRSARRPSLRSGRPEPAEGRNCAPSVVPFRQCDDQQLVSAWSIPRYAPLGVLRTRRIAVAWIAALSAVGQWAGACDMRDPSLAAGRSHRDGADRSGEAVAEWRRRIVQRQAPRRVPEPALVSESCRGPRRHRAVGRHYNAVRPHSSLGYLTPVEFKATCAANLTEGRSPAMPARAEHDEHGQRPTYELPKTGAVLQ